jgi:uncharacterized protein YkwD
MYNSNMKKILSIFVTLILLLAQTTNASGSNDDLNVDRLLKLMNKYRSQHGVHPLVYDVELEKAAKLQATYNHKAKRTGDLHYNPVLDRSVDRMNAVGVATIKEQYSEICYALLNLDPDMPLSRVAAPYANMEERMFEGYKGSPSHAEAMRNGTYDKAGIYTVYDGRYIYNTVVFMSNRYGIKKPVVITNVSKPEKVLSMVNSFRQKNKYSKSVKPLVYSKELETLAKNQAIFDMYHQTDDIEFETLNYKDLKELNPNTEFSNLESFQFVGTITEPFKEGLDNHCIELFKRIEKKRVKLLNGEFTHMAVYSLIDYKQERYVYVLVLATSRNKYLSNK